MIISSLILLNIAIILFIAVIAVWIMYYKKDVELAKLKELASRMQQGLEQQGKLLEKMPLEEALKDVDALIRIKLSRSMNMKYPLNAQSGRTLISDEEQKNITTELSMHIFEIISDNLKAKLIYFFKDEDVLIKWLTEYIYDITLKLIVEYNSAAINKMKAVKAVVDNNAPKSAKHK